MSRPTDDQQTAPGSGLLTGSAMLCPWRLPDPAVGRRRSGEDSLVDAVVRRDGGPDGRRRPGPPVEGSGPRAGAAR
jgi:hypothetical protein